MRLSEHFWLREFTRSQAAARFGRDIVVPEELMPNLRGLVGNVLEPFRVARGRPITITSGYRPPWLNAIIGGSMKSQHMKAEACDFVEAGAQPVETVTALAAMDLPFDQLILEFHRWVHVSWSVAPRRSILTATSVGGRTRYLPGIVEA